MKKTQGLFSDRFFDGSVLDNTIRGKRLTARHRALSGDDRAFMLRDFERHIQRALKRTKNHSDHAKVELEEALSDMKKAYPLFRYFSQGVGAVVPRDFYLNKLLAHVWNAGLSFGRAEAYSTKPIKSRALSDLALPSARKKAKKERRGAGDETKSKIREAFNRRKLWRQSVVSKEDIAADLGMNARYVGTLMKQMKLK